MEGPTSIGVVPFVPGIGLYSPEKDAAFSAWLDKILFGRGKPLARSKSRLGRHLAG